MKNKKRREYNILSYQWVEAKPNVLYYIFFWLNKLSCAAVLLLFVRDRAIAG